MRPRKYIIIDAEKKFMRKEYINRYMHLLNIISPNKYELNTVNMLAHIENKETQLIAVIFSDNPFYRE